MTLGAVTLVSGDALARQHVYQWAKCVTTNPTVLEEQMRPTPQRIKPAVSHADVKYSHGFDAKPKKLARMQQFISVFMPKVKIA